MDKILVIIAARGGSKGVKNKNIKPLLGKPLIAHTINHALQWGKATQVVVSTDSKEIADVARQYKALVPFMRPGALATDECSKAAVIKHALTECEKIYGLRYDIVVDLDVTSPLRTTDDLDKCLEIFKKTKPKSLFSVIKAHKNPYFNMVELNAKGQAELCKKLPYRIVRRQDAPQVYMMNASIYFFNRDYIVKEENPSPLSDDARVYVMDDEAGIDIDREIDFKNIEFLLKESIVKL
ncbi:MAG TPA: acylneuraminate cytidylyltransferase family protein [Candidatus Omnitrophota bacterium]|nr:acylneuraminate cytidylyltransferase family protein [Candidatus Omnitrophota bacterium]